MPSAARDGDASAARTWESFLDAAAVPKRVVDEVVLDYLLTEGFTRAAELLREEADISAREHDVDIESFTQRNEVRNALLSRDIQRAIELTDAISTSILAENPRLLFRLRRLILIGLIQGGAIDESITFAQTQLAPLVGPDDTELRTELEKALALLIFEDLGSRSGTVVAVLQPDELNKIASMLNAAILVHQGLPEEARLMQLSREAQWAQDKLAEALIDVYPVLRTSKSI